MKILYTLSIHLYYFAIRIASLFNPKAKLWLEGRKNIFKDLQKRTSDLRLVTTDLKLIWFHCASLGEFEQGRPLMEKYKLKHPSHKILLTFFSPSGYEVRKNYSGADLIFYLPLDTPRNAKEFVKIVHPEKVFFVKYEFWFNYLSELKSKNIQTFLVSGIFRENHHFFKITGAWFRKQLSAFTHFFLQDERSMELLNSIGYTNATLTGDTRFDRVFEVAKSVREIDLMKEFVEDKKVIIAGSTWPADEQIINYLTPYIPNIKLIIAPHEIDESHLRSIEAQFPNDCLRYSAADGNNIRDVKVLIIDNIGMLSSLYQYGAIAFIGGGFGKGIHNILEAATFGLPVIFGPNYHKFAEAKDLIRSGGAFCVKDVSELKKTISLLNDEQVLRTASQICKMYVQSKTGASDKILNFIFPA